MKKTTVMKAAMKQAGAMKGAMKAKKVSVVARGKGAKARVFSGKKEKTSSGLKKEALTKNKFGKVVSKKKSAVSKKNYAKTLKAWGDAVKAARKELGLTGFVAIGGKSAAGKALYAKAKAMM
eukprot:CAMPEP_0183428664 /NCGR_PEP_ID=MMETSP0370-20130417/45353_1 /TAXON_ID=268820 /ORGANISM="Peridinium aciculiferum, Strain PAER-2" /LENGTH=121 /DNA_ID=CAMNT_0025613503 /DNA_START=85 /DNA_END=450 /DNA_ORIENTATION=+